MNSMIIYPSSAQDVLDRYATTTPVKLMPIIKAYDVTIRPAIMTDTSGSIHLDRKTNQYVITYNSLHNHQRQRFTIAHELGHYFMDKDAIDERSMLKDNKIYRSGLPTQCEVRANNFAADLLMPMDLLIQAIDNARNTSPLKTSDLSALFDVSEQAIRVRLGIV